MDERIHKLEMAVHTIEAAVVGLEDRMAVLESGGQVAQVFPSEEEELVPEDSVDPEIEIPLTGVMVTLTLIGRSLLVLAGAFLFRALTEGGTLSSGVGVAAGLAYGVVWIVASALVASRGARASAGFYSVCAALITGPLLFEVSTSFGLLSPAVGVVILAVVTVAGWLVATRWRLPIPE